METQHPSPHVKPKGGKAKGQKENEGKGGAKSVKFTCLELSECDPVIEEIPGNEVNVATMRINLANALGGGELGRKNRAKDCSSVTDTGFNGGGLRSYPRLERYVEYMMIFYHNDNLAKSREEELGFAFLESPGKDAWR